jgi:hypothetical protein
MAAGSSAEPDGIRMRKLRQTLHKALDQCFLQVKLETFHEAMPTVSETHKDAIDDLGVQLMDTLRLNIEVSVLAGQAAAEARPLARLTTGAQPNLPIFPAQRAEQLTNEWLTVANSLETGAMVLQFEKFTSTRLVLIILRCMRAQEEFSNICGELDIASKLNRLDKLVADKGSEATGDAAGSRRPRAATVMPDGIIRAIQAARLQQQAEALQAALAEVRVSMRCAVDQAEPNTLRLLATASPCWCA